jgi:hypothetical protein
MGTRSLGIWMEVQVIDLLFPHHGFESGKLRLVTIEACAGMLGVEMRLNMEVMFGSVVTEVSLLHLFVNGAMIVKIHAAGKEVVPGLKKELCCFRDLTQKTCEMHQEGCCHLQLYGIAKVASQTFPSNLQITLCA